MVEPTATPTHVREQINISLPDEEISPHLEKAARDNARHNSTEDLENVADEMGGDITGDDVRRDIEWILASIRILGRRKGTRANRQQSLGNMSKTYETRQLSELRRELRDLDPSGNLGATVRRDSSRTVLRTGSPDR